jgi:RND superfamily putative drug exporter
MKSSITPVWLRIGVPALLVLVWLGAAAVGGPYFGRIDEVSTNDQSTYLPSSAEATQVADRLADFRGDDTVPAVIVLTGDGPLSPAQLGQAQQLAAEMAAVPGILGDVSPAIPSEDGQAVQIVVPVDSSGDIGGTVELLRATIADTLPDPLEAWVTGPAGFSADLVAGFLGIDGILLLTALAAVFVILIIVYRSPLLPVLVLLASTFALSLAILVVWWLAKLGVVVLNGQVQGILFILVIGAATDYALLYVARFREGIGAGLTRWEATVQAWRGAFPPILASAGTVIAGLLCLLLSDLATNRALGPIAAIGIGCAFLVALTFLPALLALLGRVAFWPFIPHHAAAVLPQDLSAPVPGLWPKIARLIARHARPVWIGATVMLLIAGAGVLQLKADGVQSSDLVLGYSQARDGQQVLGDHFPGGTGSPMYVIAPAQQAAAAAEVVRDQDGVQSVSDPIVAGTDALLVATLTDAPDSVEAESTVRSVRESLQADVPGTLVGGVTATALDTNDTSIRDRAVIIPIVLVVILLILMLLLRAVLAPLLLVASVVASFAAAMGVSALVFNHVFDFPGADPAVPLYGFVFLVALGIDYNIFLMTRVREESLRHGTRPGILRGLVATGGVITSAGLVLAATFAALGVIPILFLAQLAFIVAFGVLLDTFLVRSLLVPAVSYDIGRSIWWPSRLSREQGPADSLEP